VPRALSQYVVRRFNDQSLRYLVCTSTLIEGVNTSARNIVIVDNEIDGSEIDLFTFNNIKGRAGRMRKHFVGHVYVFHADPQTPLPLIDIPAITQSDEMADSLLVQMDESDLIEKSLSRLDQFKSQSDLSFDVIKLNKGVDPEQQIKLAKELLSAKADVLTRLSWTGSPKWNELLQVCELMFRFFEGGRLGSGAVRGARQLAAMILALQRKPSVRDFIEDQVKWSEGVDDATTRALSFYRLWAEFHFPRLLRAIDNIQRDVLPRRGRTPGNYQYFASQVQSMFLDPTFMMLEEIGIPFPLARKIAGLAGTNGDFDRAVAVLKQTDLGSQRFTAFERELLEDAISGV
jgi:hypothetical protein